LLGLYPSYGLTAAENLRRQTYALAATAAITSTFALTLHVGILVPRLMLIGGFLSLLFLAPLLRAFVKGRLIKVGLWGKPTVILGSGKVAQHLMRSLRSEPGIGLVPIAVFDDREPPDGGVLEGVPYGGAITDGEYLARESGVNTAIIVMAGADRRQFMDSINWAATVFQNLILVPSRLGGSMVGNSAVRGRDLAGTLGLEIKHNLLDPWSQRTKRALDLFGVVLGGLLISPFLLAIAVSIKLSSPGPVFYVHRRLGSGSTNFRCWKFRTMYPDAERLLDNYLQSNPELRVEWEREQKLRRDPRVTRVGRILRKSSLDELPQLWNVLRGEMSLIGPRPIVDAEVSKYRAMYELYQRVRPGMSGLWQVSGRSNTTYEERVALDAYYVRNWSVWLDMVILARSVKIVATRAGAH
jgi:Undecaprenyl-phosphate galactose phosphotransferase WbaP